MSCGHRTGSVSVGWKDALGSPFVTANEAETFLLTPSFHGPNLSRLLVRLRGFCGTLNHHILCAGSFASRFEAVGDNVADIQSFAAFDAFDVNEDTGGTT